MENLLKNIIENSYKYFLFENVKFFSDLLYYQNETDIENIFACAKSMMFCGEIRIAYSFLKNCKERWRENRSNKIYYLFSVICLELRKYNEAESMLKTILRDEKHYTHTPTGVIYHQLGKALRNLGKFEKAKKMFKRNLTKNCQPFLFHSYLNLCEIGGKVKYNLTKNKSIFKDSDDDIKINFNENRNRKRKFGDIINLKSKPNIKKKENFQYEIIDVDKVERDEDNDVIMKDNGVTPIVKNTTLEEDATPSPMVKNANTPPRMNKKKRTFSKMNNSVLHDDNALSFLSPIFPKSNDQKNESNESLENEFNIEGSTPPRKRMKFDSTKGKRESLKFKTPEFNVTNVKIDKSEDGLEEEEEEEDGMEMTPIVKNNNPKKTIFSEKKSIKILFENLDISFEGEKSKEGLLEIIQNLCTGYFYQSQYKCNHALSNYGNNPENIYKIGWIQSQIAKCYYELELFERSSELFRNLVENEPWRLEDLDIYSTVLWQTKNTKDIIWLVGHIKSIDRNSKYALVCLGNAYSLHTDHTSSISFLKKAVRRNPDYQYANTLLGHEYLENEQIKKAEKVFQRSITNDPRDYRAYYGLGEVCLQQGKNGLARMYFTKSLQVKSTSSIIWTYLGMAQSVEEYFDNALKSYDKALEHFPGNPFALLQKSEILCELKRFQEAVVILNDLKQKLASEFKVYKLLGLAYKNIGESQKSLEAYERSLLIRREQKAYKNQGFDSFIT